MKNRNKSSVSQLFNFVQDSYFDRTSRPIYAIVFLLPFIIFYELGTLLINTDVLQQYWQGRVVAFLWLQKFLEYLGFTNKFTWIAPPLVVIIILLAMQIASKNKWKVWFKDIGLMGIECILFSVPLIVLGLVLNTGQSESGIVSSRNRVVQCQPLYTPQCAAAAQSPVNPDTGLKLPAKTKSVLANIVTGIGAGIYEELVFRLILICLLMMIFQDLLSLDRKNSIVLSVLISAALFSAHHHIDFFSGQMNPIDPFSFTKFIFRTIAGVYFAGLFAARGFGVTAGTHAFYDILATLINTFSFDA